MSQSWGFAPSFAAEFPSDNPALHLGVSWVCLSVSGAPRPVLRAKSLGRGALPEGPRAASSAITEVARPVSVEEASQPPSAPEEAREELPESVLGLLLQTLDLDLTPDASPRVVGNAPLELELEALPVAASPDGVVTGEFAFDTGDDGAGEALDYGGDSPVAASPSKLTEPATDPVGEEGVAAPVAELSPVVEAAAAAPVAAVVELAPVDASAPDPYAAFVKALVEVALGASSTRAAAALPGLLEGNAELESLGDDVRRSLSAAGITTAEGVLTSSFVSTAVAWRKVLRGESQDFSACGATTLDVWATGLLEALGVATSPGADLRRELRRRGVAAFGMLLAA